MEIAFAPMFAALVLAGAYAGGYWLDERAATEGFWARRRWISAAAGVSVAYVFVDLLPELAAQNRVIIAATGHEPLLFAEQRVYVLALLAFVVLYGLEYVVLAANGDGEDTHAGGFDALYALHLVGFALYSGLIGYLLVGRAQYILALGLYTLAMGLHFLIVDHSLMEAHGARYERRGRWVLAGSVLVGWGIAELTPLSELIFARLFAVLAGGVVITSLRQEMPNKERGRFWPFCIAALLFAIVLLFA